MPLCNFITNKIKPNQNTDEKKIGKYFEVEYHFEGGKNKQTISIRQTNSIVQPKIQNSTHTIEYKVYNCYVVWLYKN